MGISELELIAYVYEWIEEANPPVISHTLQKRNTSLNVKEPSTVAGACQLSRWAVTLMDAHSLGKGV